MTVAMEASLQLLVFLLSIFMPQRLGEALVFTGVQLDTGVPPVAVGGDPSFFIGDQASAPDFLSEQAGALSGPEVSRGQHSSYHVTSPPGKAAQSNLPSLLAALSSQLGLGGTQLQQQAQQGGLAAGGRQSPPLNQAGAQALSPLTKALLLLQQLSQTGQTLKGSHRASQPTPAPTVLGVPKLLNPSPLQRAALSNLFTSGLEKPSDPKLPADTPQSGPPRKPGGLHPIPGLSAPPAPQDVVAKATTADCDPLVDVIFALDDLHALWLARDAIRYYVTHLRPAGKPRFGVMLCGADRTFYTALHTQFSGLLASLEDLQHANATLDPNALLQPDSLGLRSNNNPYPPRVSEDFAQTDARCLETAYYMFMYQSRDHVTRLLAAILSKERWVDDQVAEEARYLQSFNISMVILANGAFPAAAVTSLKAMASSPRLFRAVSDNVTLHALPGLVADVMCAPASGDVTVTIAGVTTTQVNGTLATSCRLQNATALERITDFGQNFGRYSDVVLCKPGTRPDPHSCACV